MEKRKKDSLFLLDLSSRVWNDGYIKQQVFVIF